MPKIRENLRNVRTIVCPKCGSKGQLRGRREGWKSKKTGKIKWYGIYYRVQHNEIGWDKVLYKKLRQQGLSIREASLEARIFRYISTCYLGKIAKARNGNIFIGLNSKKITAFLSEDMEGLTAKVFRTYKATKTFFSQNSSI